jgi:nucleotide-binding universal stress UspA family protein
MTIEAEAATTGEWELTRKPIVVAVDGSERNRSAVAWAAHEAAAFRAETTLVCALPDHVVADPHFSAHTQDAEVLDMLSDARAEIRDIVPETSVSTLVLAGDPVDVLLDRASSAGLVVVGKRGLGGFARIIVGSTSIALAGRSPTPVAIVPDGWDQRTQNGKPVVLGIDLEKVDREPIEAAFQRARRLGVPLVAVHGRETPTVYSWDAAAVAGAVTQGEDAASEQLSLLLETWRERYPDVVVRPMRAHQHPAAAVLEAAQDAQVIVLGRHPAGLFGGFAFGSVARTVLHYAECPVLVVPADGGRHLA